MIISFFLTTFALKIISVSKVTVKCRDKGQKKGSF